MTFECPSIHLARSCVCACTDTSPVEALPSGAPAPQVRACTEVESSCLETQQMEHPPPLSWSSSLLTLWQQLLEERTNKLNEINAGFGRSFRFMFEYRPLMEKKETLEIYISK